MPLRTKRARQSQVYGRMGAAARWGRQAGPLKLDEEGQIKHEALAASPSNPSSPFSQAKKEEDHFYSERETSDDDGGVEVACKMEVKEEESAEEDEDHEDLIENETMEEESSDFPGDEPGRNRWDGRPGMKFVASSTDPLATSPSPPAAEEDDTDDDDGVDSPNSTCLLCAGRITQDRRRGRSLYPGYSTKDKDFLVMFVLKKMLGRPNETLEKYLRLFGHPRDWVSFCPRCMPSVKSAFGIQKEINKLEDKLRKSQEEMKTQIVLSYVKNEKKVISAIAAAVSEEKQREDPLRVTRETWCYVVYDARVKPGSNPKVPVSNPEVILVPTYVILNPTNCAPSISPPTTLPETEATGTSLSAGSSNPGPSTRKRKQELTRTSLRSDSDSLPIVGGADKDNYDTKWCTKLRFKNADSVIHSPGYSCPLCPDLKRMKVDSFVKHIIYHKGRPYTCSVCGIFLTGSEVELGKIPKLKKEGVPEDHVCTKATMVPVTFHPGNIWECGFCEETFSLEEERRAHETEVHRQQEYDIELPYECSWCSGSNKFRDYVEWRLHRALEHPELAKVACFHCDELIPMKTKEGVDFEDTWGRRRHIEERHGANARPPFSSQCFICGKVLNHEGELKKHVAQGHGLDRKQCRSCPVCFSRFARFTSLRTHIRSVHSVTSTSKKFISTRKTSLRCRPVGIPKTDGDEISDSMSDTADDGHDPVDDSCDYSDSHSGDHREPVPSALTAFQERLADVQLEETPARRVIKAKKVKDNSDNYDGKWSTKVRFKKTDSVLHSTGYTCPLCPDVKAMKLDSYAKHIIYHKGRPYKCSVCGIYLTGSETELAKIPKRTHNKGGVPEDHVCTKATLIPADFQPGNIWECGSCDETFSLEEERSAHEKDAHGQNESRIKLPYECSWCSGNKFRDYVEWRLHRALEHPEHAKLACFYCDEIFSVKTKDIADLQDAPRRSKQIKECHGPKAQRRIYLAECTMCGENFGQEIDLQNHMEQSHGLDRNQCRSCPICFSRYPRATNLMIHIKGVHYDTSKEKFICDVCGYENVNGLQFKQHKFMVHGIEPEDGRPIYSCTVPECSFKCLVKMSLETHRMKAHNAARRHKCDFCGKGFLNTIHLREHRKIHLNASNKPFQCEICGNSFALRNYLYIHMRLSHQNRPFASANRKRPSGSVKRARTQKIHGDGPQSMSHVSAMTSGQYNHVPETSADYLS